MGITQLNFDGITRYDMTINRIRDNEPPEGYYLAFSGGKDSIVIYNLALEAGVKFDAHYNVSPIDPPEIHQFIKEYYPNVIWDYNAKGFWGKAQRWGVPTIRQRWCCKLIKECGGKGRIKMLGVRTEESASRKRNYTHYLSPDHTQKNTYRLCPIYDWTEYDVWNYIEEKKLTYCCLYDEGYSRIGCIMCPLKSKGDMRMDARKYPKIAKLWYMAIMKHLERRKSKGVRTIFDAPEEVWRWWIGMEPPN